jgi:hypothetical protein
MNRSTVKYLPLLALVVTLFFGRHCLPIDSPQALRTLAAVSHGDRRLVLAVLIERVRRTEALAGVYW